MPTWWIKAAAQGAISLLPMRNDLNYLFQKYVSHSINPSKSSVRMRLQWCGEHINYYQKYVSASALPKQSLELGTGWTPVVPLALYLSGIDTIYTVDIHDLKKPELQTSLLKVLCSYSADELGELLPTLVPDRFAALQEQCRMGVSSNEVYKKAGIHFLITDARKMELPDGCIDFFVSNTTFEHISGEILGGILKEFRRVAAPDALMSHLIDMSDHYSYFDHSLSVYHYLGVEERVWRLVNNPLMYQSRLRLPDYRRLHDEAGFDIVFEKNQEKHAARLDEIKLAKAFQGYDKAELIPSSSWMVSKPRPQLSHTGE